MKNNIQVIDGNTATAQIAFKLTEFASIYPITPSTTMAEFYEEHSAKDEKNIFGETPKCIQMQSEAGVAGTLHGALCGGALSTTFTCSQGLLLMIPNMYKIAGEFLPCVIHTSARTISTHALNIFGDHSDVMACAQTGFALVCANNPQECADLAIISHMATYKAEIPILHFFDGFRTSHEIQKVGMPTDEELKEVFPFDEIKTFKNNAITSSNPYQKGTAQNSDIFFQNKYAGQEKYKKFPNILQSCMDKFKEVFKREYNLVDTFNKDEKENAIVIMGSGAETIEEVLTEIPCNTYLIKIRLFTPFPKDAFLKTLTPNVKNICVMDRCNTNSQNGEPLYKEIVSAIAQSDNFKQMNIINCVYGLGGKDFNADMAKAVIDYTENFDINKKRFISIGINDDVCNTSIPYGNSFENKHYNAMFFGIGSDGTIGASKNTIKVIGETTNKYVQGFFEYDSKKSGGLTVAHLRFSDQKICSTYKITKADFIAIHNYSYLSTLEILPLLKENSTLLINTPFNPDDLNTYLTKTIKSELISKKIKVYAINAYKLAQDIGLRNRINTIMQGAFFSLCDIVKKDEIKGYLTEKIAKTYAKKGENIVAMNTKALNCGFEEVKQINICLNSNEEDEIIQDKEDLIFKQLNRLGDNLKVSQFNAKGIVQTDTTQLEDRNISNIAPCHICENCIQCNLCALACPHSVILPKLINEEFLPDYVKAIDSKLIKGKKFALYIDTRHCTGCGVCESVCPAKNKAIVMKSKNEFTDAEKKNMEFLSTIKNDTTELNKFNLRHIAYFEPYFKFSGACAGCGETPYIKLLTQLFGNKLTIANATGCSSIYSGSAPTCPFTKDENGFGPAWANSLFEDNAEFGLGIKFGQEINGKDECVFIIGGDGWAYDIGFGGLDHILSSGKNVNILVLDSELYSNTGGQCSKATPQGASGKFCTNGKKTKKKPLSELAMLYENVFVAQVSLGANTKQCIDAFKQAVEFNGVSLIIAYCPCTNHGIDMSQTNKEMAKATSSGHWPLFIYNPTAEKKLQIQSKKTIDIQEFKINERRFTNDTTQENSNSLLNFLEQYFNGNL